MKKMTCNHHNGNLVALKLIREDQEGELFRCTECGQEFHLYDLVNVEDENVPKSVEKTCREFDELIQSLAVFDFQNHPEVQELLKMAHKLKDLNISELAKTVGFEAHEKMFHAPTPEKIMEQMLANCKMQTENTLWFENKRAGDSLPTFADMRDFLHDLPMPAHV